MKIYAINGSARKKWNTATILQNVLDGFAAKAEGAQTEMIDLYTLKYTGCTSCFQCKRLGGKSYGRCAVRDDLHSVLEKVLYADALVFGSPIYFSDVTGMMRSFFERLLFPCFVYDKNYSSIAPRKIATAFAYTMNVDGKTMELMRYPERLAPMEGFVAGVFGSKPLVQYVNDTYQFPDYSKYKMEIFREEDKAAHREKQFPIDCENARAIGAQLAKKALELAGQAS